MVDALATGYAAESSNLLDAVAVARRRPGADAWLLRDVHCQLTPGDRVALTGATGSGKSILLRCLARLDPLDAGCIRWRGAVVQGRSTAEFRAEVVYLHQSPAMLPGTVADNLRAPFALRVHRRRDREYDERQARRWLAVADRDELLAQPAASLSGGERQLVALVRAVQLHPAVLLLDEPTAALDDEAARAVERVVAQWFAEAPDARAYVWVSHDRAQADRVGTRQWQMHAGRLQSGNDDAA